MLEVEKYEKAWSLPEYRLYSIGEQAVDFYLQKFKPEPGAEIIDFGCGTGRAAKKLSENGYSVTGIDLASNSLNPDVDIRFIQADITKSIPVSAKYGYCTDVLEHLPTKDVTSALINILSAAKFVFLQIAMFEDHYHSGLVGGNLHLTVKPYEWWKKKLSDLGATIIWSLDGGMGAHCLFYVTAWGSCREFVDRGKINVEEDQIRKNIEDNMAAGWQRTGLHEEQEIEIMLLGGGPSLEEFKDEILENKKSGMPLVTTNGSYHWALENGMFPDAQIVLDAREFNARFTSPVLEKCKYLIASQCHPSTLESLPRERTWLWHASAGEMHKDVLDKYGDWIGTPGGSTVILRAIALLRQLGFKKIHIYGFDSCLQGEKHHAYPQSENDMESVVPVEVGGKTFQCHPWMASQAQEFIDMIRMLGDSVELAVHGNGLISHIIAQGASNGRDGFQTV